MKREDVIRMAGEAGFNLHHNPELYDCMVANYESIERFAFLVAAAERKNFCAALRHMHDAYSLASDPSPLKTRSQA